MTDKIEAFRALHIPGDPLVLFNIWDAGSAKAVAAAGAKAIATGSYGVACARGSSDGENLSLDDALANLGEILAVTDLPVSIDMEAGYGAEATAVGRSVARARDAGAVGINMEDRMPGETALLAVGDAAARIAAAHGWWPWLIRATPSAARALRSPQGVDHRMFTGSGEPSQIAAMQRGSDKNGTNKPPAPASA